MDVIVKFRDSIQEKYNLASHLAELELKISKTLDDSFYWNKEEFEQSFTKQLQEQSTPHRKERKGAKSTRENY